MWGYLHCLVWDNIRVYLGEIMSELLGSIAGQSITAKNKDPLTILGLLGQQGQKREQAIIPEQDQLTHHEVGRAYYQLGKIYYDKSDLQMAEDSFLKAISCSARPRDTYTLFKIYGFLIRIASERLEDEKASQYIKEAEILIEELTAALGSLNAEYFYNAGVVKNYSGHFLEAKQNFDLALKKSREENEPELLAKCLMALANNAHMRKEFDLGIDYLRQLDDLLRIINKNYLKGTMHLCRAKIWLEKKKWEEALEDFKLANIILHEKNCWNLYGYVLLGKGQVCKVNGDYERSLLYYNLAYESIDRKYFKRLSNLIETEIQDVNDASVDIYLDRINRKIKEKTLGIIDFKHRFVLLEILFLLAKNRGEYYDKEQLAKSIWKDEYNPLIHDKLIYTSVSRLRKLIEPKDLSSKRKYIIRGKDGYTFNPDVRIRFQMESKIKAEKNIGNVDLSSPV